MMAPTRPTELHQRRVQLAREPAAAAEARRQVRAAIGAWDIPVDSDIAVLLTSDLVTSAITCGEGKTVTLAIRCACGHLRIDVYDTPGSLPMAVDGLPGTGPGPGLVLVAALSTGWGSFRTDAGKVSYFMLAFQSELPSDGDRVAVGGHTGDWKRESRLAHNSHQLHTRKMTPTSKG
ncbi:MAG: hypothetical protein ABSA53_12905 [Streptosporangiaceae bacterium]